MATIGPLGDGSGLDLRYPSEALAEMWNVEDARAQNAEGLYAQHYA